MRRDIHRGRYLPQAVRAVRVPKHNELGEWRELGLPTVLDKIVQTAMAQVLEPRLEQIFSPASFAYRPGKGHQRAIRQVDALLAVHPEPWVVRRDIDNFFDSLDHRILLEKVAPHVDSDPRVLELIALWCKNGVITGNGSWRDSYLGVRQGHVIAPLLANLCLHSLDRYAESFGCGWVRYADDYLAVCNSRQNADELDRRLQNYLRENIGLGLNTTARPVTPLADGFSFLGIGFCGNDRCIAEKKIRSMKKRIRWIMGDRKPPGVEEYFGQCREMAEGWRRCYGFIEPDDQFKEIDEEIERGLIEAIRRNSASSVCPTRPPDDLAFPFIRTPGNERNKRKRLTGLWRSAMDGQTSAILRSGQKKTDSSRKKYTSRHPAGQIAVTSPGHFIGKSGKRLVVRQGKKTISETPIHLVRHLLLGSRGQSLSTDVIHFCLEHGVHIHFLDERGNLYSSLQQPGSKRLQRTVLQIDRRDEPAGMDIARSIIRAKMKNQLGVLKNFAKYNGGNRQQFCVTLAENKPFLQRLITKTRLCSREKSPAEQRQHLMGIEGVFAGRYWKLFSMLLTGKYTFPGRKKQGATDPVNSMLNYGYGILYAITLQAIHLAGLSPETGFLHCSKNKRPALSLDLIEIFRAPVVDRTVVSLLNRRTAIEVGSKGMLTDESRKKTARAVLQTLRREITWKGTSISLTGILEQQVEQLALHLEGKIPFTPYLYKW